jgi:hypothetical protein
MFKYEADEIVGGLSHPDKMPCPGISIPAEECQRGSKLREIKGSVCFDCYACKGFYHMPVVKAALERRSEALHNVGSSLWKSAMVKLMENQPHFRWHDAGDLQGLWHLDRIIKVAILTPDTAHWLPTHELGMISEWFGKFEGGKPKNLTIRLSADMIDKPAATPGLRKKLRKWGIQSSTVHDQKKPIGVKCRATKEDGCGACRICWDPKVENVSYARH